MIWSAEAAHPEQYGQYVVGQRRFHNKIEALVEATRTNIEPYWYYYPQTYTHLDWSTCYGIDIRQMYAQRARQLRDKYDRLVLHYSGGSDSHTILETFLNNNIRLDEIYVRWPVTYTERHWKADRSDSPVNFLSEWELTMKPALNKLRSEHPEITITVNDLTDNFPASIDALSEDMFVGGHGGIYMGIGSFTKMYSAANTQFQHLTTHRVGNITGADKPMVLNLNGTACFSISDLMIGSVRDHSFENIENFYITPDMPELSREQCHLVLKYFNARPDLQWLLEPRNMAVTANRNMYFEIVKSVIYPDWDRTKFQATKRDNITYNDMDYFLFRDYQHRVDYWESILNNIKQSINPKYWEYDDQGRFSHFRPLRTPAYKIGPVIKHENT